MIPLRQYDKKRSVRHQAFLYPTFWTTTAGADPPWFLLVIIKCFGAITETSNQNRFPNKFTVDYSCTAQRMYNSSCRKNAHIDP